MDNVLYEVLSFASLKIAITFPTIVIKSFISGKPSELNFIGLKLSLSTSSFELLRNIHSWKVVTTEYTTPIFPFSTATSQRKTEPCLYQSRLF